MTKIRGHAGFHTVHTIFASFFSSSEISVLGSLILKSCEIEFGRRTVSRGTRDYICGNFIRGIRTSGELFKRVRGREGAEMRIIGYRNMSRPKPDIRLPTCFVSETVGRSVRACGLPYPRATLSKTLKFTIPRRR